MTAAARAQAPPVKYALLVGLNDYRFPISGIPQLHYAIADLEEVDRALREQGYKVVSLPNDRARREDIVAELSRHAALAREEDSFLLYFAGHGVRSLNRQTYWLTYDAKLDALDVNAIRLRHLLDYLKDIRARRKLVLLDHCFSGDLVSSLDDAGGTRQAAPALRIERNAFPVEDFRDQLAAAGEGFVFITASRGEAYEMPQLQHGLFTYVLLEALAGGDADEDEDGKLSIEELKTFLRREVAARARRLNAPQEVIESTRGVNLSGWIVADLPASPARRVEEYKAALSAWASKRWISPQIKTRCWQVLLNWTDAAAEGLDLGAADRAVLERLHEAMDPVGDERARADALEYALRNLPGAGR